MSSTATQAPESPPAERGLRDQHASVDTAFVLVLGTAALAGLAATFTGWQFLVVGVTGLLIGALLGWVARRLDWPIVAPVLLAAVVFYLLGGALTLRSEGLLLPTPATWSTLTDQALFGWKDLLTTLPPVDGDGVLLVLPWLLGLLLGVLGVMLAGVRSGPTWLWVLLPLLPAVATLGLVILLGSHAPQSLWVQGALFTAAALGWLAVRNVAAAGAAQGHAGRGSRLLVGATLVGLAALLAMPLASVASAGRDDERVVLRDHVVPPFDVGKYPSPLASFRRYVDMMSHPDPENLYEHDLFRIEGVPAGTRVRFATLDSYDGVVWGASNNAIPGANDDTYQRVSSTIDNPVTGRSVEATVTVADGYSGVWLPVVGALQSLHFDAGDTQAKADTFRYNLATSTAVVPSGIRPGDRYSFDAVLPDDALTPETLASSAVGPAYDAAAFLDTQAREWTEGEATPMASVYALAHHLRDEGKYTDGVTQAEKVYPAGHYLGRLLDGFVNARIMAGNDEQYAATMALLANRVGVPARVVMGAVVPADGMVRGSDVSAWVEVRAADGSWRTLPTEEFMGDEHPAKLPPESDRNRTGANVPPAAPIPPPSVIQDQTDTQLQARKGEDSSDRPEMGSLLPAWLVTVLVYGGVPLLVVLSVLAAIMLIKGWRRARRRSAGAASTRVVGAWRELVDHARDLGQPVPVAAAVTRREQGATVLSPAAPALARRADAHVFGPAVPEVDEAAAYWDSVTAERRAMSAGVSRWRRWWARVSLASFRGGDSTMGSGRPD
ncbi:transglutaminase-like domain-containing protein [Nocardioides sp.]|uniref:transglutaminase-like domain-containing protein n=1 Tax=Nocardioides sp. TaxID=35761 RepID=UPI003529290E